MSGLYIRGNSGGCTKMKEFIGRSIEYVNPLDNPNGPLGNDLTRSIKANSDLAEELINTLKSKDLGDHELQDNILKALNGMIVTSKPIIRKGLEILEIENRRRDHWDVLKDKCESDPMFKEQWDELMLLLKLEQD